MQNAVAEPFQNHQAREEPSPAVWASRALQAIRAKLPELAWLWADKLCRNIAGPALLDAYLLRSAAFAELNDVECAEQDLRAAAQIDPDAPVLNRALLASPRSCERLAAARRLISATNTEDRDRGFSVLARAGIACVGRIELTDQCLAARLAWNGATRLRLAIRTDLSNQEMLVEPGSEPVPPGFERAGSIRAGLPQGAHVATISTPDIHSVIEPASLLLPPPSFGHAEPRSNTGGNQLLIVVPVYSDRAATMACLGSVLSDQCGSLSRRVLVVDDASPDSSMSSDLDALVADKKITMLRNTINMGFAASVNRALRQRRYGEHVLLLNADTIMPAGAIEGLARHVRDNANIGTVTPLSNNGEDTSIPQRFRPNPMLTTAAIAELHNIAAYTNAGVAVDMPNGVGFCLYIRGELLDRLGALSHDYGRGYYEDVALCLNGAALGFRNVCATDVYVGHHGSRSFGSEKRTLVVRNLRRLQAGFPSYFAQAQSFEKADPLKPLVGRIEEAWLRRSVGLDLVLVPAEAPSFLIRLIADTLMREGTDLIVVRIQNSGPGYRMAFTAAGGSIPQNLIWQAASSGECDLGQRLASLPLRSAALLDAEAMPTEILEPMVERGSPVMRIAARPFLCGIPVGGQSVAAVTSAVRDAMIIQNERQEIRVLRFSPLPQLRPPRVDGGGSILAVIGANDATLLRALAERWPGTEGRPSIVVAGNFDADEASGLPAEIHVAGHISEEELPAWLTRLRPAALFFADRVWAAADPRASLWEQAGIAVARFDWRDNVERSGDKGLLLPSGGSTCVVADAIATWLAHHTCSEFSSTRTTGRRRPDREGAGDCSNAPGSSRSIKATCAGIATR